MSDPNAAERREWVRGAVARYEAPLTLYAARLVGDADAARDIVQDAFLRLCDQDRERVEPRLAEWLFTVCRNRAFDLLRKERRMTRLNEHHVQTCISPGPDPSEAAQRDDLAARALELLETLPAGQREVIRLKFQNGFSYQEISRISGFSVSNVGYLIHTGMTTLRSLLADAPAARTQL